MSKAITRKSFLGVLTRWSAGLAASVSAARAGTRRIELRNEFFRVALVAGPQGLWLEEFAVNQEASRPGGGFTESMVFPKPEQPVLRSGTAILPEAMEWMFGRLPSSAGVSATETRARLSGIMLGPDEAPIAREKWHLELNDDAFVWQIEREFLRDAKVVADRFPALVVRTHISESGARPGSRFIEIPGFLDSRMSLDGDKGFPLRVPKVEWREVVSPVGDQAIQFAPSGLILESRIGEGSFSYAKPFADGTSAAIAVGADTVDRQGGAQLRQRGTRQKQTWTLRLRRDVTIAPFELELPDAFLAQQARSFAAVHNQWMGWMFGNNPCSVPVLQEMAWFPMIQGLYARTPATLEALKKQLLFFASGGVEPDGYVLPRWGVNGFYRVMWGNLLDQVPHFILAMYFHAINTGDRDFLLRVMPALDKVAQYMLALDRDRDGVLEVPGASGLADGGRHCSGWYDIVNFGHKDGYLNVYSVAALEAMAEMKAFVGDAESAARFRAAHSHAVAAYNRVFWDNEMGLYMDWIDEREKMPESGRRYFYTDHNLLAIIFGIADAARASRILAHLDRRYDELCRQFRLPREAIYATPCNMYPVTRLGDLVDSGELQNQKIYPNYENGCSFFHTTGLEIAARGVAGQAEAAYDAFDRVIRHGYARNRLWAAALKWDTGELISEPLNNALLILWGFVRGCLGIRRSLERLSAAGQCSRRLEGAQHSFCYRGKNVAVKVRGGKPVF